MGHKVKGISGCGLQSKFESRSLGHGWFSRLGPWLLKAPSPLWKPTRSAARVTSRRGVLPRRSAKGMDASGWVPVGLPETQALHSLYP